MTAFCFFTMNSFFPQKLVLNSDVFKKKIYVCSWVEITQEFWLLKKNTHATILNTDCYRMISRTDIICGFKCFSSKRRIYYRANQLFFFLPVYRHFRIFLIIHLRCIILPYLGRDCALPISIQLFSSEVRSNMQMFSIDFHIYILEMQIE